jgi:hypothetical protein
VAYNMLDAKARDELIRRAPWADSSPPSPKMRLVLLVVATPLFVMLLVMRWLHLGHAVPLLWPTIVVVGGWGDVARRFWLKRRS